MSSKLLPNLAVILAVSPLVVTSTSRALAQPVQCSLQECAESKARHSVSPSSRFGIIYGMKDSVCLQIQAELNASLEGKKGKAASQDLQPRRPYPDIDFERLFQSPMFARWHKVPTNYHDPNLFPEDKGRAARADAWTSVSYLNDDVQRLVVAWPHGQEFSAFTVDTTKLFGDQLTNAALTAKLSDESGVTSKIESVLDGPSGSGLPVYFAAPMSNCIGSHALDPLQGPEVVDSSRIKSDGKHCSAGYLDQIHLLATDLSRYPTLEQLMPYGQTLDQGATEFAYVNGKVRVLYVNTDVNSLIRHRSHGLKPTLASILIRVIKLTPTNYTDECLLGKADQIGRLLSNTRATNH